MLPHKCCCTRLEPGCVGRAGGDIFGQLHDLEGVDVQVHRVHCMEEGMQGMGGGGAYSSGTARSSQATHGTRCPRYPQLPREMATSPTTGD